jgi:hypothetical protein
VTTPATFNTPAGWIERYTRWDNYTDHQIRIWGSTRLYVTCLCRDEPFGQIKTAEEALEIYRRHYEEVEPDETDHQNHPT